MRIRARELIVHVASIDPADSDTARNDDRIRSSDEKYTFGQNVSGRGHATWAKPGAEGYRCSEIERRRIRNRYVIVDSIHIVGSIGIPKTVDSKSGAVCGRPMIGVATRIVCISIERVVRS